MADPLTTVEELREIKDVGAVKSGIQFIGGVITFFGVIAAVGAAWLFYKDNFWKPVVKIISIDLNNGSAIVNIDGVQTTLYNTSAVHAGGDWGVRLGGEIQPNGFVYYDRIELIKNSLVYDTLYKE